MYKIIYYILYTYVYSLIKHILSVWCGVSYLRTIKYARIYNVGNKTIN